MGKKNTSGGGSSSKNIIKGKNGPSSTQNNKKQVGADKQISKGQKKEVKEDKNDHSHVTLLAHPIQTI